MKNVDAWLDHYGESHQNKTNKIIHWVCIPFIMFSVLGLLASIPVRFGAPWLHLGTAAAVLGTAYYFALSPRLAVGMLTVSAIMLGLLEGLAVLGPPLWASALGIFVAAWVVQFIGHEIEGKKPSFFEDVQFLMIGPLWLLAALYRRVGLSYVPVKPSHV